jgi:hypothetical protein
MQHEKDMTMPERRTLSFASLDQVMPDVDRLLAGYTKTRNWTLGQTCKHLTLNFVGSIEGFSANAPWLIRRTIGPVIMGRIIKQGWLKAGFQTPEAYVPAPGLDDRAEAEALRASIQAFSGYNGLMAQHPFGGNFSREKWERLHRIHSAHHLSFLVPDGTASHS